MKPKKINGVPEHYKGSSQDTESVKKILIDELVMQKFEILKQRFFSVNYWKDYCGKGSADFKLFDREGVSVTRDPNVGDYIRIDIPGPGDVETKGYDWVQIKEINNKLNVGNELETCLITCYPSKDPNSDDPRVAHFYSPKTSSTFVISRGADFIKVGVYLRNEIPNKKRNSLFNKIRNFFIYIGGKTRFTKIQWKSFTDGLLDF